MTINPILAQMDVPQEASTASRQKRLGRWLHELEGSESTQGSELSLGRPLAWLSERLVEYRTCLASARRVHRKPLLRQKCNEERDPVRHAGATRVWDHGRGRSEPCGMI
jgi:hypothetical protein